MVVPGMLTLVTLRRLPLAPCTECSALTGPASKIYAGEGGFRRWPELVGAVLPNCGCVTSPVPMIELHVLIRLPTSNILEIKPVQFVFKSVSGDSKMQSLKQPIVRP